MIDVRCFDLEGDSLNPTKIHCLDIDGETLTNPQDIASEFSKEDQIWVGHNVIRWDVPVIERLCSVKIPKSSLVIDTLALSWYLFPEQGTHNLDAWGEVLGIEKPSISDWENLSLEEYIHRCKEDVRITRKLWEKQYKYLRHLYSSDEEILRLCRYLSFKMYCARLKEESGWKLDVSRCKKSIQELEKIKEEKKNELAASMPRVPIVAERRPPKNMFRANGELSEHGRKWRKLVESKGLPPEHDEPIEVITGYNDPNPDSPQQVKKWLFELGWIPRTFKTNKAGEEVPQINKQKQDGGGLCESIIEMFDDHPELAALDGYYVVRHRLSILEGFLRDVNEDGFVTARVAGFTNTLRLKHAEIVNLPKIDALYGEHVRACLIAPDEDHELCGSDMSGLENNIKLHFIYPYDPEYVKEQSVPGFDSHLDLAKTAGKITDKHIEEYKSGVYEPWLKTLRSVFKNGNYACQYGAGPPRIAKTAGISLEEAREVHRAYWERNWSLKEIPKSFSVKTIGGQKWVLNPVSKFWYTLREEKDRFSTVVQSTGAYCFDLWVFFILQERPQLTADFHDEIILTVKKGYSWKGPDNKFHGPIVDFLRDCLKKVNDTLKLNVLLDIDVQFGERYSEIH